MAKKNRTKQKKNRKVAFLQNWGTHSNQTLVCAGMDYDDMLRHARKIGARKEVIDSILSDRKKIEDILGTWAGADGSGGMCWVDYKHATTLLMLPDWKNNWAHFDTLVHEVTHLVHAVLGHMKNMMDEDEARAYQTEYMFREIRRKLFKMWK